MMRACVLLLLLATPGAACPFCDGVDGDNPVREAVFGPDFWPNLLAAALPFAASLAVVAAVRFAPSREGRP